MKGHKHESKSAANPTHWVLVANASRAQLFECDATLESLTAIDALTHPESRLPTSELVSGDRGATREAAGGAHSSFERHSDPHQATVDVFARELAAVLNAGRIAHRYQHLVTVAPPELLGALRSHLDVDAARLVVGSIAHDWTAVPSRELATRVRDGMPAAADVNPTGSGAA
ncbi:MAG: host attachment protein [Myxococcota bacterium]